MKNGRHITDTLIFRNRWWQHILFWAAASFILVNLFKGAGSVEKIDLIYTFIFLIPILASVYLNLYILIPRFLSREKYFIYLVGIGILVFLCAVSLYFLFDRWIDYILPNYYFISYYSIPQLMLFSASFLLLATLLKLSRSWFKILRIERISSENQLKSLQSQINPHFLLNSLQTIYALSLEQSDKTPKVILQLSDILKYTLYETENPRVDLESELKLLREYIEMQRLRLDPVGRSIKFDVLGDPEDLSIAPMLLLPFIENSFKHGLQGDEKSAFVSIHVSIAKRKLNFSIENNAGKAEQLLSDKNGGIGISNTRQRLELIYPGRHQIEISELKGIFSVKLVIDLRE